ncbi:MFS transporter [Oryzibacter oryziterrae]|uniref:MFS transporter n=1 Tax=Oryzibacter oryziterrae TaxID=2766474 RepID=UPI001F02587A|nr:MFS transporter [Oryzibacter oryziterrae]
MTSAHLPLPEARRTALLLAVATAIGGSIGVIAIGSGGLIGASLLPAERQYLATLPVTAFILGSALASIPAALLMRRVGRRAGFVGGALMGAACAAGVAAAIMLQSFWLLSLGNFLLGVASAFGQQYRFAAADASEPAFKAKAISWVMVGGVVTGVLGPQIVIYTREAISGAAFAGPFVALSALLLVTAAILSLLRVPPPSPALRQSAGRPLAAIITQRRFVVALVTAVASYALMTLVMTASPLAMIGHNHSQSDAQLAIQWHVIAMFAPSFFTGSVIARLGKEVVAVAGLLLIALCATIALTGTELYHFWGALILLGVGWNFGFVAATSMVAEVYRPEESFRVQAVNDFILFGLVALASYSSGKILVADGWQTVNLVVFPVVGVCLMLISADAVARRRAVAKG